MWSCIAPRISGTQYHFVIVRSDLPVGFVASQIVHASGESAPGRVKEGTFAVVLDAKNEPGLVALAAKLKLAGIAHVVVREPDAPCNGAVTAIGIEPTAELSMLRRLTSSLPLYGKVREDHAEAI